LIHRIFRWVRYYRR